MRRFREADLGRAGRAIAEAQHTRVSADVRRPNFTVLLTDDQAYCDLGCMGATDLATPHLDALAGSGALLLS
jgi:arylsulfatase A-like enzyme